MIQQFDTTIGKSFYTGMNLFPAFFVFTAGR